MVFSRIKINLWQLLTLLLLSASVGQAQSRRTLTVQGSVIDAAGHPLAGARVAQRWSFENGSFQPASEVLTSDAGGSFKGDLNLFRDYSSLFALDSSGQLGAVKLLTDDQLKQPLNLTLEPLQPVQFSVITKEIPGYQEQNGLELFLLGSGTDDSPNAPQAYLADLNTQKSPLRLPPGPYRLLVRTNNIRYFQQRFKVQPGQNALDLGELVAPASKLGQLFGKPAPNWTAQEIRGLAPEAKLQDFKGKWLVLEFWAHWCVPCVNGGIPRLKTFYQRHQKDLERFQAVAIHDSSLPSLAEVDKRTAEVKQRAWGNEDLPFPIVLDKGKQTFSDWGVGAIPCVLLVSPDGTLIRTDDPLGYLEKQLASPQ